MSLTARLLLAYAAVLHLAIGGWELLVYEERAHKASAWQLLYQHLPEPLWAVAFLIVGAAAAAGALLPQHHLIGRLAFYGSAALFAVWALYSALSWTLGYGATMAGTLQLAYVSTLQIGIAEYVLRANRVHRTLERLETQLVTASVPLQDSVDAVNVIISERAGHGGPTTDG